MILTSVTPGFDYAAWRASVERVAHSLMYGFEAQRGYPPHGHDVGGPADDDLIAAAPAHGSIPGVSIEFYRHIGGVSQPDVRNAYFVHPLRMVLNNERDESPVRAPGLTDRAIVVFGSDGGGALFAIDERGVRSTSCRPGGTAART